MNFQVPQKTASFETTTFRKAVYCLSLTLACVYWTYYGAISVGAWYGWNFISAFLAPVLAFTVLFPLLSRIAHIVRRENFSSLSEFLSARYGKSRAVGALVTATALVGTVPFIAQQLKSLSLAWISLSGDKENALPMALIFSGALIAFAIWFGARRPAVTEQGRSLIRLVAVDAVIKGIFILVVALVSAAFLVQVLSDVVDGIRSGALIQPLRLDGGFFNTLFLLTALVFCLPHLFYAAFARAENIEDLKSARWFVPLYVLVVGVAVVPILLAGRYIFPGAADPEMYVLKLAGYFSGPAFSGLIFLSSAWTAALLVTLASVALSGMLSDQLFQSGFVQRLRKASTSVNIGRDSMHIRRIAIALIVMLGLGCSLLVSQGPMLTNLGVMYASIFVQLLPAMLGAVLWPRGHSTGVLAGLAAGVALWLGLIAIPFFSGQIPQRLFDLQLAQNPVTNAFVQRFGLSLIVNAALYVSISLLVRPRLVDRIQSVAFIDAELSGRVPMDRLQQSDLSISVGDLKALIAQFLGERDAMAAFADAEKELGQTCRDSERVSPALVQAAERILAGVVGAPLAHSVIFWQLANQGQKSADVVRFLDETAQAVKLNREMLQATLNNLSQGVCVVDKDFGLVAWNDRYVEIFDLGPGVIRAGTSLADIIRINRSRSGYSADDTEQYIRRRLRDVRLGIPHVFERTWSDGKILRVIGMPMSDGRYVTSFTDVTSVQDVIMDLRRANERLEERVQVRTMELTEVNDALQESTMRAEFARASQARFLAAASHDLLQPLHAARLFLGALQEQARQNSAMSELVKNADVSIESANRLLNALLNLSRLEVGGVRPEVKPVDVSALLQELQREFKQTASAKGLTLRMAPTKYWVMSDPDLLRSVLQNLIGNALRYTQVGAVLVVCRKEGESVRFEVRDSGPGIPEHAQETIFKEYFRLSHGRESAPGSGLGLSIVERICRVLHYPVGLRSALGKGSTFMVTVPRAEHLREEVKPATTSVLLSGLSVLCVEHEPAILQSLQVLFSRWDVEMTTAHSIDEALSLPGEWDVILTDYHFDEGLNGLDLIERMPSRARVFALITADTNEAVTQRAAALNVAVLRKPVAPAALRTFLTRVWLQKSGEDE